MDPGITDEKKIQIHETPTRKKLWTHEIPTRKNLDPRNTHEKNLGLTKYPRRHGGTMTLAHEIHDSTRPNLAHSLLNIYGRAFFEII